MKPERGCVVIGGGRHAACIVDALRWLDLPVVGSVDDVKEEGHVVLGDVRVLGGMGLLPKLYAEGVRVAVMGVGGVDNAPRRELYERVSAMGFGFPALIHPAAPVAGSVLIGAASVVLAAASVGPLCRIGENVIVNQGCIICHHTQVEDDAHVAPGAVLAGGCRVGRGATVGMGATVYMDVEIGEGAVVCNGANVLLDVPDGGIVRSPAAYPARRGT